MMRSNHINLLQKLHSALVRDIAEFKSGKNLSSSERSYTVGMRTMLRCCGAGCWRQIAFLTLCAAVSLPGGTPARAAIELRTVATGLSAPIYVTHAGDGSGRLFIVEQGGLIRILSGDTVLNMPFLDLSDRVHTELEAGLLGMAFHPNYSINGRFFVNYVTEGSNGLETIIAEYAVSPEDANVADTDSEEILLRFPQDTAQHNGGMLAFGPDGFLYIATGDGGVVQDLMYRAQNLETLLGKVLRIDVDSGAPYGVPPDNPFVDMPGRDEIWAYGLRNPWRFSIDPVTGRLIAGDVGRTRREEVDIIEAGGNYGWNTMEGTLCFLPSSNCNTEGLIPPVHEYDHGPGCAITGGYVYRGTEIPSLWGKYLFADFCSGQIGSLTEISAGEWQSERLLQAAFLLSSFGEDESGELYIVGYEYLANPPNGTVRKIVSTDVPQSAVNENGVVNAASFLPGPVAPGQIVSIFGSAIGPEQGVDARLASSGRVDTFIADTKSTIRWDPVPTVLCPGRPDQRPGSLRRGGTSQHSDASSVR